jgi:hypothetical protein
MRRKIHILFRNGRKWPMPTLWPVMTIRPMPALWLVAAVMMLGTSVSAQEHTDRRTVTRQFQVERETELELQNKYGKIQVATWDKDSLSVMVEIILTESSASKLRKLKEEVSIDFSRTNDYIAASTKIRSENGRIASELKSVGFAIAGSNKHMEINYTINMPAYMDLKVVNKFGDIYMDDLEGKVEIDLSNGALKAGQIGGNSTISLSFANGVIKSLGSSDMSLIYSELDLGDAGKLEMESKSSTLNADSVNVLRIDSRRDKLYFQRVEYLYGSGNFTQIQVLDFLRESDIYLKYGKLTIEHVLPGFSKIYVESDFADVTLLFDPKSTFAFDILHHENAVLKLPNRQIVSEESFDGKEHYRTTGTIGGDKSGRQVTINALQKCFVNLAIK